MSKKYSLIAFVFACLVMQGGALFGQEKDFQNWNKISIEKEVIDDLSISLDQEVRLHNNASALKDYISVIGGSYRINKYAKVQGLYRLTVSNDFEEGTSYNHRWYADAMLRYRYARFIFGYRCRYQMAYEDYNINRWHHIRNRFSVKYDIPKSKILPYAQYEFYYSLNNPIQNSIEKTRYTFGLEYALTKDIDVSAFYRIQKRRNYGSKPYDRYILGISASYSF